MRARSSLVVLLVCLADGGCSVDDAGSLLLEDASTEEDAGRGADADAMKDARVDPLDASLDAFTTVDADASAAADDADAGPLPCELLSPGACRRDSRCESIDGLVFDSARLCVMDILRLGCVDLTRCAPHPVYGRTADGLLVQFLLGCAPADWELITPATPPTSRYACEYD